VAFTADLTEDVEIDLRRQGFHGGVAKPIEAAALLRALTAALEDSPAVESPAVVAANLKLG